MRLKTSRPHRRIHHVPQRRPFLMLHTGSHPTRRRFLEEAGVAGARTAIVLTEIIGKPVSMRSV